MALHAEAAIECPTIDGFEAHVLASNGVFISDFHGTEDSPKFLGDLVCNLIVRNKPVVLGLEYPREEQESLDRFLKSTQKDAAKELLKQPFWQRSGQDGRSSQAMLDLLERVRALIRDGGKIRVVAFDGTVKASPGESVSHSARDRLMANVINDKINKDSGEFTLLFAGNAHVRKTKGLPFQNLPPEMQNRENVGYLLRGRDLLHLNVRISGGTMWTCRQTGCGIETMPMNGSSIDAVAIKLSSADPAYDGYYEVGDTKASPPAVAARRQSLGE